MINCKVIGLMSRLKIDCRVQGPGCTLGCRLLQAVTLQYPATDTGPENLRASSMGIRRCAKALGRGNLGESLGIDTEILGFISGRVGWSEVTGFEVRGRGARVRFGNIEGVGVLECQWVRSQVRKISSPSLT